MNDEMFYNDVLKKKDYIFIDVRSPIEYDEGSIPNSINIPILDNNEREQVGTAYKNDSKEVARTLGVNFVSKKLPSIYDQVTKLSKEYDNLIFYCARGGYRSSSLVSFLSSIGHRFHKLNGGYKAYRQYLLDSLPALVSKVTFIVLYGNTGVSKTHILDLLKEKDYDVLDLEKYANHRGSVLGGVGLEAQNSQKDFEGLIFDALINRKSDCFFIEGESKRIGRVSIPNCLFDEFTEKGINVKITSPLEKRAQVIYNDYIDNGLSEDIDIEIIDALNRLRKRIGNEKIDEMIECIESGNYTDVITDLMLKYYDPLYESNDRQYVKTFNNTEDAKATEDIINWFEKIKESILIKR